MIYPSEEVWKDVKGFNGYQVSNKGRVRTHNKVTHTERHGDRHWEDRILWQRISKDKCSTVDLWKDGKPHRFLVYRLEAEAFLGKPTNQSLTINHKDGNRLNNDIDNLEWIDLKSNIQHGFSNDLYPQVHVTLFPKIGNPIEFTSMAKASKYLGKCDNYLSSQKKKRCPIVTDINGNEYSYEVKGNALYEKRKEEIRLAHGLPSHL